MNESKTDEVKEESEIPFAPASASRLKRKAAPLAQTNQGRLDGFGTLKKAKPVHEITVGKKCSIQQGFLTRDQCLATLHLLPANGWQAGRFKVSRVQDPPPPLAVWKAQPWLARLERDTDGYLTKVEVAEYRGTQSGYLDWSVRFYQSVYILCLGSPWVMEFLRAKERTNHWIENGTLIRVEDPENWTLSLSDKSIFRRGPTLEPCKRTPFFLQTQIRFFFSHRRPGTFRALARLALASRVAIPLHWLDTHTPIDPMVDSHPMWDPTRL